MISSVWILIMVALVVIFTAAAGIFFSKPSRFGLDGFVTARDSVRGVAAMTTIVASIMGGWILFSPAEAATWAGLVSIVGYAVAQALPLFAFAVLGPRIRKLAPNGHALTEFTWFRYGRAMYVVVLIFVLLYMVVFLGAEMGAIARVVRLVADVPLLPIILSISAATLIYTAYGGLRASIFTDRIQFLVFFPLLAIIFGASVAALGGWDASFDNVRENSPALLRWDHRPGIELGITFLIGVFAANLFHQGFWQRVYAVKNTRTLRWSFIVSGVLVMILIIGAGIFGLWAVGLGLVTEDAPAGIALFTLVITILPSWAVILLTLLALVLVMSSLDTLLNGIASVLVTDLHRLRGGITASGLLWRARMATVFLIIPVILIGYFFDSVLYPFLVADLVSTAGVVPVFIGMYVSRFSSRAALISTLSGLVAGAIFFPTRNLQGWWTWEPLTELWDILASGNLVTSFLAALIVSSLVSAVFLLIERNRSGASFDFNEMRGKISLLDEPL